LFFSSRNHRNFSPRRFGALVISGALVASIAGLAFANSATATHGGEVYANNADCDSVAPAGVEWDEFKIDGVPSVANSPYDLAGDLVITITNASSQSFDWASNFDMAAVLVKGGPLEDQGGGGGVRYMYPGDDDRSDTGLHALPHLTDGYHGISHVTFCYLAGTVVTTPTTTPTTSTPTTLSTPTTAAVAPAAEEVQTTVLGETLVAGDTLPRTGAAATNMLVLAGGLGLAFGLMMLMLGRRKTAIHSS
jgi:LPXTG-motif cell wall-anchored protein